MSDSDYYCGSRPYTCVECGAGMRTRGADGRCYQCLIAPAVRCATCARVRYEPGEPWQDHPGRLPREVEVQCEVCAAWAKRQREIQRARMDRKLLRDRAKGYGGPAEGEDVFRGFRTEG
jgi:hypothetical protein